MFINLRWFIDPSPERSKSPSIRSCNNLGRCTSSALCRIPSKWTRLFSWLEFENFQNMWISIVIGNKVNHKLKLIFYFLTYCQRIHETKCIEHFTTPEMNNYAYNSSFVVCRVIVFLWLFSKQITYFWYHLYCFEQIL